MPTIRRATDSDAPAIATFAACVFHEWFSAWPANREDDLRAYMQATYGEEHQRRELADPTCSYLLAESDDVLVGYALMQKHEPPECVTGPAPVEILRFYVDASQHGRGVAQALMQACADEARRMGARTIWLGVWEHNDRAHRFYEKVGFRDVGSHPFLMGADLQRDRWMEWVLPPRD